MHTQSALHDCNTDDESRHTLSHAQGDSKTDRLALLSHTFSSSISVSLFTFTSHTNRGEHGNHSPPTVESNLCCLSLSLSLENALSTLRSQDVLLCSRCDDNTNTQKQRLWFRVEIQRLESVALSLCASVINYVAKSMWTPLEIFCLGL